MSLADGTRVEDELGEALGSALPGPFWGSAVVLMDEEREMQYDGAPALASLHTASVAVRSCEWPLRSTIPGWLIGSVALLGLRLAQRRYH